MEVYTKAPEVTLYLNDKPIGTKAVSQATEYKAVFTVPYEAGILRAEADGKSATLSTAGEPARLRLTADRSVITAGGQDLSFITVEVIDRECRVCPNAAIPCEAIVKGQGTLLSFASADLKDCEPYTSPVSPHGRVAPCSSYAARIKKARLRSASRAACRQPPFSYNPRHHPNNCPL